MHAQQHAKQYFKFFNASDQAELRPNPCRTRHQAGPGYTQLQILLSACQISKFQNFHNFLNSHQPKGCFLPDRQKSPEFYPIKKVFFFQKGTAVKKRKKERHCQPAPPTPKRSKKNRFWFLPIFFFDFCVRLLDAVRKFEATHRSEVNIKRVMTQNLMVGS